LPAALLITIHLRPRPRPRAALLTTGLATAGRRRTHALLAASAILAATHARWWAPPLALPTGAVAGLAAAVHAVTAAAAHHAGPRTAAAAAAHHRTVATAGARVDGADHQARGDDQGAAREQAAREERGAPIGGGPFDVQRHEGDLVWLLSMTGSTDRSHRQQTHEKSRPARRNNHEVAAIKPSAKKKAAR
jgi:hypothetical protein